MSQDGPTEDQIAVAQKHPKLRDMPISAISSSRPADVTGLRQTPDYLQPKVHPNSSGSNGDGLLVPTVKEQPMSVNSELKIHWAAPVGMIAFAVCGVSFAIGHHAYYSSLNGTDVRDNKSQQWAIRFGTAFALLVEVPLAAAVGIAQTQRAWTTVERKSVSIEGIDSIFASTRDLGSFVSWEMLSRAKLASLLALICWCLPLSALVTPATLTVQTVSRTRSVDHTVPGIDFNDAAKFAVLNTSILGTLNVLSRTLSMTEDNG